MKKQKIDEKISKVTEIAEDNSDDEEEKVLNDNSLTPTEIYQKQKQTRELNKQIEELIKQKQNIEEQMNQKDYLRTFFDDLKKPRDQFVFKLIYDDGIFHEESAKNYLSAVLKSSAKEQNQEIQILKIKTLSNYIWFKLDNKIVIKWFTRRINGKENFIGSNLTQLRPSNFFEDI